MAGNTSKKKEFNGVASPIASTSSPSKVATRSNKGPVNDGQMKGNAQMDKFADPLQAISAGIGGLAGTYDDIGEKSGFIVDGYLDKNGTPYGEAAKFNFLPPGMDISNQENCDISAMPLRKLVAESYPGDGWMPAPRDIPE